MKVGIGHARSLTYVLSIIAFHSLCFDRSPFHKIHCNCIRKSFPFLQFCWAKFNRTKKRIEKLRVLSAIEWAILNVLNRLSPRFLEHISKKFPDDSSLYQALWYWIILIILNESWWWPLSYEQIKQKITSQSTVTTGHLITQTLNDSNGNHNGNEKWLWQQQQQQRLFYSRNIAFITNHCYNIHKYECHGW